MTTSANTDARRAAVWLADTVTSLVYPLKCPVCGGSRPGATELSCSACAKSLGAVGRLICPQCRRYREPDEELCESCRTASFPRVVCVTALLDTAWRDVIHALKYGGDRSLSVPLGRVLARSIPQSVSFEAVIAVPTDPRKRRERGFGHAELVAKYVGEDIGADFHDCGLEHTRRTKDQTRLSGDQRASNLRGAFRVSGTCDVSDRAVLVVDDVMTTGATLREAGRALFEAGAQSVWGVVLCLNLGIVSDAV